MTDASHIAGEPYVRRLRNIILHATEQARRHLDTYHARMKAQFDKKRADIRLPLGTYVLVRLSDYELSKYPSRKLAPRWSSPARVLEASPDGSTYVIERDGGTKERVNVHRLLPIDPEAYAADPEPAPVQPQPTRKVVLDDPREICEDVHPY